MKAVWTLGCCRPLEAEAMARELPAVPGFVESGRAAESPWVSISGLPAVVVMSIGSDFGSEEWVWGCEIEWVRSIDPLKGDLALVLLSIIIILAIRRYLRDDPEVSCNLLQYLSESGWRRFDRWAS